MNLQEAIKYTIEAKGESFIKEKVFFNYLCDFQAFKHDNSTKNIFKQLCASGYMNMLYDLYVEKAILTETKVEIDLKKISLKISQDLGYKNDNVLYCLENIACALGILSSVSVILSEAPINHDYVNLVGYWDFTYHNNKTMQLTICRDGFAKASSGTNYKWILSGDEVKIFIPGTVSYKGKIVGNEIKGTAYSTYNNMGWEWSAKKRNDGMIEENLTSGEWVILNDVEDLDDNIIRFRADNVLESNLYGIGQWFLHGDKLEIITADDFIKYTGTFSKGKVLGKGKNRISNVWNFKLIKR